MPKISIIIINYNAEKTIGSCLNSVLTQSWHKKEIIIIDNASTDRSLEILKTNFSSVKIIKNTENFGYSKAANQGIRETDGDFVMIMNPDIVLEPDYIEKILECAEKHPKTGAFSGKLLKYNFELGIKTNIFDSTGLYCYRNRRIIDRGQGLKDFGQYENEEEVFGVTGAAPIYRREALEMVKINDEYFDEDFFMYKEDIDLTWRMRLFGWSSYYVPKAVSYHGRGTGVLKRFTHWEVAKNRRRLSRFQKSLAYRNQRLMQIKNEMPKNFIKDALQIFVKEFLILGYIVVREPYLLSSVYELLKTIPKAIKKRKIIMNRKIASQESMQKWFQS
ncbi:glycosyltransferase family 2 protein [Candidatus Peregrinibacteria bacterium]|nr:glycosyltransferase family 2 protein [Candidatus Peregrinibacteria bacterium]